MKILIIEDEKDIGLFLQTSLKRAGWNVDWKENVENGLFALSTSDYDLLILDLNLPDGNGIDICKKIRTEGKTLPILVLTVDGEISSKVELLDAGVDDYLTKPFSISEVLARIRALLRRPNQIAETAISNSSFQLNENKQSLLKNGKEIYLTRKEYMLIEYLIRNHGRIISRGEILEHVWESEADIFSNTIETHILNLRKKLDSNSRNPIIRTYSGRGYALD